MASPSPALGGMSTGMRFVSTPSLLSKYMAHLGCQQCSSFLLSSGTLNTEQTTVRSEGVGSQVQNKGPTSNVFPQPFYPSFVRGKGRCNFSSRKVQRLPGISTQREWKYIACQHMACLRSLQLESNITLQERLPHVIMKIPVFKIKGDSSPFPVYFISTRKNV